MTEKLRTSKAALAARTAMNGPIDCGPDLAAELAELDRELDFELTDLADFEDCAS